MTACPIARPRLIRLLAERWRRRAVLVIAGPGCGKSTLLADAVADHHLSATARERLVSCSAATTVEDLLAGITPDEPGCLLIDDADLLPDGTVIELMRRLPGTWHLVVAARRRPAGLAVLRASGDVVQIDEADLHFDVAETVELAAAHGVDPGALRGVDGWPAGTAIMAVHGAAAVVEYLGETVGDGLTDGHRRALAVALALGGADDELLQVTCGAVAIVDELAELPLVRRSDRGALVVNHLWADVVGDALDGVDLGGATRRAVDVLVQREEFDRAFGLCAGRADWDAAAGVVRSCCRRGHAAVTPDVAESWLHAIPVERRDEPDGLLLRGLVGRVRDPFGAATADVLERAVAAARSHGDVGGEIAAGVELVYVLRNQGRTAEIATFILRAIELDEQGHPEAAGPAAVGRALIADLDDDDAGMIDGFRSVPPGSLSPDWQTVVAFRSAMGHLVLGNEAPMLAAADRCAEAAHVGADRQIAVLARWFAGDPDPAFGALDEIAAAAGDGGIPAVLLHALAAMVTASAGRLAEATNALASIDDIGAGPRGVLLDGAVVGVRALTAAARGDDDTARAELRAALESSPITERRGWRRAVRWLPLAYVLVPEARDLIAARAAGTLHERRVDAARAVVWALEGSAAPPAHATTVSASALCTCVPLPWAMVLAARLANDGAPAGARIATDLFRRFGDPARDALRTAAAHPRSGVRAGARTLLGTIAMAPAGRTVRLCVLGPTILDTGAGPPNVHWKRDRVRSLLVFLAITRTASRVEIADALWPHLDPAAAERNLRVTLCYLQQVLEPGRRNGEAPFFLRQDGPSLSLGGTPQLHLDIEQFDELIRLATSADEHGTHAVALAHLDAALDLWRGPCLADVAYEEWAQGAIRELGERFVGAAIRAGEMHLAAGRPDRAARYADRALAVDEWRESAHQLKIAAALRRGDRAAASRAITACDAMLAELGVAADDRTEDLRRAVQRRARALAADRRTAA